MLAYDAKDFQIIGVPLVREGSFRVLVTFSGTPKAPAFSRLSVDFLLLNDRNF